MITTITRRSHAVARSLSIKQLAHHSSGSSGTSSSNVDQSSPFVIHQGNTSIVVDIPPPRSTSASSSILQSTHHPSTHYYNYCTDARITISPSSNSHTSTSTSTSLRRVLTTTFLPTGYPSTVAPGYLKYVSWQALHHAAGAANGVLASTFLLYAVGLGSAGAIPAAGALNWVLKDGLGQLGTLLFGRAMAHNFDVASRGWYVTASVKLNMAMALEISTFFVAHGQWFLPLGAIANAVKGLAWMAGGSARSAFNVAFAIDRNIADCTAKATSQTICTSLIGTALGMGIASSIGQSMVGAVGWGSALAAVHLWTSIESAHSVPLATLNPSRLQLLVEEYVGCVKQEGGFVYKPHVCVSSPAQMTAKDRVLWLRSGVSKPRLVVGASLSTIIAKDPGFYAPLLSMYRTKKYILVPDSVPMGGSTSSRMFLVLHDNADSRDVVCAMIQAYVYSNSSDTTSITTKSVQERLERSLVGGEGHAASMVQALAAAGWDVNGVVIEPKRKRAVW